MPYTNNREVTGKKKNVNTTGESNEGKKKTNKTVSDEITGNKT